MRYGILNMSKPIDYKPLTEEVEIGGIVFTVRSLGPIDLVTLGMLGNNIPMIIKFLVERGTVEPVIEDANNVRTEIVLELAQRVQRLTREATKGLVDEEELEKWMKQSKPPKGMIV